VGCSTNPRRAAQARLRSRGVDSIAQQIAEAFPWNTAPTYLVRDNDRAYGQAFQRRIRAMGIPDRPIALRSPWQNPYAERLIGTLRRECLDHILITGERHLRQTLASYSSYYNETRTRCGRSSRRGTPACGRCSASTMRLTCSLLRMSPLLAWT
jgi:transposase InsO family protein